MDYDIKITGGTIVDGTGAPGYAGDIGLCAGKIAALGEAPGAAGETIDAAGKVVSPGFVDIHTHYDAQIMWDRRLSISPWHGVTTVVVGNCGFGVAPTRPEHREMIIRTLEKVEGMSVAALQAGLGLDWPFETFPEYLDAVEARGAAINVGVLLGHTPLRTYVMGEAATEREATAAEVAEMQAIVRDGIDAGAIGFATSKAPTHVGYEGRPVPSRAAAIDEIYQLAGVLGEAGKGVVQATAGRGLFFDEFVELAERTGRTVTWTALLAGLALGPGTHREQLARSVELAEAGHKIVPQVTPRALNFEYQFKAPFLFEAMSMFKPVSQADFDGKRRLYADPEFRQAFMDKMDSGVRPTFRSAFSKTVISQYDPESDLDERPLFEVAAERGTHPVELALDLALATDLEARFRMPVANHDEDEVEELLVNRHTVIGLSDAGAHASQLCDACLPTYLLSRWVREKGALGLEEAVRMLTSRPAEVFGIADRGRLAVGLPADVLVFDPTTVGCGKLERVYDLPGAADRLVSQASGIDAVIVNGQLVRRNNTDVDHPTGRLPGKLLRNGRAA